MLLALCALGAAWDLLHARPVGAPPVESLAAATAAVAPGAGEAAAGAAAAPARTAAVPPGSTLDLNRATAAELDALPGIGPVLASRIVEHRRLAGAFGSVDELLAVRGIGPHLLERLRPLVTAGGRRERAGRTALQDATPAER